MRWLIFLSRVAFLCGIVMLLAFSLLFRNWNRDEALSSSMIMAGYSLGLIMIPVVNLLYLVLALLGKRPGRIVPGWLIAINILFFIILCSFIFYFNDPYYNQ